MSLAKAIETGDLTQLPSRRDEDWRWTDLRGLIRQMPPRSQAFAGEIPLGPFEIDADETITFVNGFTADGEAIFTQSMSGEPFESTMKLRFISQSSGTAHTSGVHLILWPGMHLVLFESYEGLGADYLSEVELRFVLEEGSRVTRIVIADDAPSAISVSAATVVMEKDCRFEQVVLTTGAKRQRIETTVHQSHGHASVRLDGAYLLRDQRHADTTSVVTHSGLDGTTSQLTKGVVHDQARGVFQGRIVVEKGADKTDARMGHHALILSDRAEIDAKPELLIFADDVQCAHGNTIGALDENALFYARQRGIPLEEARALLTTAFVGEVVDRIEHEGAREVAAAWVSKQLGTASDAV